MAKKKKARASSKQVADHFTAYQHIYVGISLLGVSLFLIVVFSQTIFHDAGNVLGVREIRSTKQIDSDLDELDQKLRTLDDELSFEDEPLDIDASPEAKRTLKKEHISIASRGAEGKLIHQGNTGAMTKFPLSVDPETHVLTVTTPHGVKQVSVLPDKAIEHMLAANVVNRVASQSSKLELTDFHGVPVYEIDGVSDQKLFGFIPVGIRKKVKVSASTGQVAEVEQDLGSKLLDAVAF
jgi:hypothetical protein